jgi:hypothetical protein
VHLQHPTSPHATLDDLAAQHRAQQERLARHQRDDDDARRVVDPYRTTRAMRSSRVSPVRSPTPPPPPPPPVLIHRPQPLALLRPASSSGSSTPRERGESGGAGSGSRSGSGSGGGGGAAAWPWQHRRVGSLARGSPAVLPSGSHMHGTNREAMSPAVRPAYVAQFKEPPSPGEVCLPLHKGSGVRMEGRARGSGSGSSTVSGAGSIGGSGGRYVPPAGLSGGGGGRGGGFGVGVDGGRMVSSLVSPSRRMTPQAAAAPFPSPQHFSSPGPRHQPQPHHGQGAGTQGGLFGRQLQSTPDALRGFNAHKDPTKRMR